MMNGFALEILRKNQNRMNCVALADRNGSREITWEVLADQICRVAAYARKQGLRGIVPVCMDRGMEVTATLLGLNLAGVGVAPLSVTTPAARCELIAAQVKNRLWTAETFAEACLCPPADAFVDAGGEADPAYVVFTSGSTGTPKGVMLSNRAILESLKRNISPDCFDLEEGERMLQSCSLSFIVLAAELFAPLYAGATVYILPEEGRGELGILRDFINRHGITCLFMPPQLYRNFEGGPSLRRVVTGSDRIVNVGPKGHRLVNLYGMTESCSVVFHYEIREPMETTPIGFPCEGVMAYILDEEGRETDEGELCISGPVAEGYLGQEELSRRTFTPNPFSDDPNYRTLLHTGDIVRRLEDGSCLFLCRRDNMIKVNGQRVEPGEIEAALMAYPGIATAAVRSFADENGRSIICAYYTCSRIPDEDRMRAFLAAKLPHYMVPAVLIRLDRMPLNSNGKLDRKALAMPDLSTLADRYEAPESGPEELLCRAFQKVLGIPRVGRNGDLFRLGGDSISVQTVVHECAALGISTGDVFAGRTPRGIALLAGQEQTAFYLDLPHGGNRARLTESQMGILLECGLGEETDKYNIAVKMTFGRTEEGTPDAVRAAADRVIEAHPALYAQIVQEGGEFFMLRRSFPEGGICEIAELEDEAATEAYAGEIAAPVALGRDPLCRAMVCFTRDKVFLLLRMHHVVSDGSGVALIAEQITAALHGQEPAEETVDAFSLYEAECRRKQSGICSSARAYYEALLGGEETDSILIPDHKPAGNAKPMGATVTLLLPKERTEAFLENTEYTENTFFMSVYGYVLAKMTGQKESVFAVAENGRDSALLRGTVSMLVRTIPVVVRLDEEKTGRELMAELQTQFFDSLRNDSLGFEELAREYGVRSDVMFVYQGSMLNGVEPLETGEALSSLSLMVLKRSDAYELRIGYRRDLYEEDTVRRFADLYERAAEAFLGGRALKEMVLLSGRDRAFLDAENASTDYALPDETVVDIFRRTAGRYPGKPAIIAGETAFTYREADEISDRIAAYLLRAGIGRGRTVGILIARDAYMLIASLGVLKAGAAYQPLDPSCPEERLTYMTEDAGTALLIRDRKFGDLLRGYSGKTLYTDEIPGLPARDIALPRPSASDPFIVLYTSGTTGRPKGVVLSHGNMNAFVHSEAQVRELDENAVVSQYASYGFDAHMHEIYPAVLRGCTIVVIPDEIRLDLARIKDFCESRGITHLFMTTQVARQFAAACPQVKGLRMLDTAGEKLPALDPRSLTYRINNLYGPTEGTVCSTRFALDRQYDDIPIGKAIPGYRIYVADDYGRRVPVGVPGELIQCGPQVGLGYLNRPDLTEKAFVANTFEDAGEKYRRCYKTGDIVRFRQDGNLEYIGRQDQQVKIRGFRVEPGEVEKVIRDYPTVKDAVVTAVEAGGGKNLCAYVVADEKLDIADLNRFIAGSCPAYMVPAVTMQIDRIPLNTNGKVDRRKLPAPEMHFENVKKPGNRLEQQLFDCVSEVIGTDTFGIETDLFLAGLSSIGSIRLCTLLAEYWQVPVRIRDLKKYRTVAGLEEFLRAAKGTDAGEETAPGEKPLSSQTAGSGYGPSHPVTKTMEGIFTECLSRPGSTVYNIPCLMKLGSGIDEERLKRAIVAAVEAHPCMKAELFTDEQGTVRQHRKQDDTYTAGEIRICELGSRDAIRDSLVRPFALTGSRLFEISLLHADGLYLFVNMHHIISDGTSRMIFLRDVEKAYAGLPLTEEDYSAFDVAEEEKQSRTKEELKAEEEYYTALLAGTDRSFLPAPDRLPGSPAAPGAFSMEQQEADAAAVRKFCSRHRIGLNAYFVSVFGTVLARYAGTEYSVFNTVYNGRNDSRLGNTVAMLVKTLPVVCHTDREKTEDLLRETASQLMDSMSNDLYSFAEIRRKLDVTNDVMFIFQGDGFTADSFCGEKAEEVPLRLSEAKAPWVLQVMLRNGRLVYELEYDPQLFTEGLAQAFVQAYDRAAASFLREEKLRCVSLLSAAAEKEMEQFNATEEAYDRSETIAGLFMKQVRQNPEKLCVSCEGRAYTYARVAELTARLSYFLMKQGIGRGDIVAILIRRDENMVIGAHGVIRAGAAYLGLDPTYPAERLAFMLKDSGAAFLIADRSLMHLLPEYPGRVVFTDEITKLELPSGEEPYRLEMSSAHRAMPEDPAVVIYSSGTTGVPKGSVLRQRNIVCFYHDYTQSYRIGTAARVATCASFGFDGGAMDVFCVPMAGASLSIVPDEIRLDLTRLEQFYIRNGITNGFMTTQMGCMFISRTKCRTLRYFMVGGEKLIPVTGPEWVTFTNGYGPSETMCYVNKYRVTNTGSLQPIGKVSRNTKEYVLDRFGNRLPFGACGELCIAGGQVGLGYLNRPGKTAEVFVKNPFCSDPDYSVMYRTGDMVRMLPDGNYDFVGRQDGQVKIRGFRVELGEVEQQIRKYPGVTNAAVKAWNDPAGGKFLAAYVVMNGKLDADALKNFIAGEKPDYMVPSVILQLDALPLTANGKTDTRQLPKPERGSGKKGTEPANETEEKLCGIFREVLGIEKVYADDDFFKIGGSSISAIQVVVKCEQNGYPVVYKNLFANPTPQKLAAFLFEEKTEDITAADLNRKGEFDSSALRYNVPSNLPKIRNDGVGDVLLTGATGFLGSHIFRELIESGSGSVICLVRSSDRSSAAGRLEARMVYYFEDWYSEEIKKRVTVIIGGIEDADILDRLSGVHFDTIINCAANVKHFAVEEEMLAANCSGAENMIGLAEATGARLIQISSLSVCGESVNGSVPGDRVFRETDLNIGQSLENRYVYSKYLAEQAVIDAISKKRIRGKVIRLGNLMARTGDGQFQANAGQNGMLRLYLGCVKLGCFPVDLLDSEIEFSPIDRVARAVVLLSGTPDEFTVFHASNCNPIHYSYLLQAITEAGYPVEIVEDDVFEERLKKALEVPGNAVRLAGLLAYRNSTDSTVGEATQHTGDAAGDHSGQTPERNSGETRVRITTSNAFTTKALYRLGFAWPLIGMDYLRKMVRMLVEFDFFER